MDKYRAYANSGLESLAAEASRRAESLDADLDREQEPEPKSPTSKGKVRKAYTITKQRERWTEEEHDRFLQALKRYGRAWRKIEEHIGTKTAVQIRSHAQKFFSKLQREQTMNGGRDESSKNDISIPPPRPKRKPMHPYPRNSVDSHSDPQDQPRSTRHQPAHPQKLKDSEAASTQVPTSNQYSTSSGHQPSLLNTPPLFQGQHTPFAGSILSPQPSQVQLPPFPSLDTSGGENMSRVLKDAALAAASAWNQVISGASPKVQTLIQAQSFQPPAMNSMPSMWPSQYLDMEQNPFMRQLLLHASQRNQQAQNLQEAMNTRHGHPMYARQQSTSNLGSNQQDTLNNATAAFLQGQQPRAGGLQEKNENARGDSDRDSACSKEEARPKFSQSAFNPAQGASFWSTKTPYGVNEAILGRTAWEMMNHVTAQKSRELNAKAKTEDLPRPKLMQAPSTGASNASRRIMKPIAHSARISPLHARDSNLQSSTVCSDTSQLAQFYQRAAAQADAQRVSQSPDKEEASAALYTTRKSDKGSNNGTGSDAGKDNDSNGSDQGASPKLQDLTGTQFSEDDKKGDLGSNGSDPKANGLGSDKASNNGNASGSSDEDAILNGSDLNMNATEEKGSNNGSNSDQVSPREATPVNNGRSSTQPLQKEAEKAHKYSPEAEPVWVAGSLQHQQKPVQDSNRLRNPSQAEMVQQILPFTLTRDQQAAISSWAAVNAQSQPQQYQLMQSLLNGLTSQGQDPKTAQGTMLADRQISGLTSHDTGSNTDCNLPPSIGRGLVLDSHRSAPGELHKRPSGFQPYNKRPADSSLAMNAPPQKRFAAVSPSEQPQYREPQLFRKTSFSPPEESSHPAKRQPYTGSTPFGSHAAQSGQVVPIPVAGEV